MYLHRQLLKEVSSHQIHAEFGDGAPCYVICTFCYVTVTFHAHCTTQTHTCATFCRALFKTDILTDLRLTDSQNA